MLWDGAGEENYTAQYSPLPFTSKTQSNTAKPNTEPPCSVKSARYRQKYLWLFSCKSAGTQPTR
ncbi:hypothetical protein RA11412_2128 [Rothia aeria]|uniref:Uncharacterized protein n=1 Tax=Rothia aeria TaxID=172042 RepID=A0A2Z5R111_9MICC|nr:hypothetical protein RA11412_2128 [Rothia aeria]